MTTPNEVSPATDTAVIVLAAGGSTRLGSPKQLLVYEGKTLLRRAVEAAREVSGAAVVVVLGAEAARMKTELAGLDVVVVENPAWAQGMGGSIRRGMEALEPTRIRGVMLTLCDQPLVGARELATVMSAADGEDRIVAAAYDGTTGVPVWFGRAYFDALLALPQDAGAKALLRRYPERVVRVDLPEAATDVDTREQYARLTASDPGPPK